MTTYTVHHVCQPLGQAEVGLTETQVVHNIWTNDDRTLRIEPKMETVYALDADGEETEEEIERQCSSSVLGLEWELVFSAPGGRVEGRRACFGADEDAAMQDALMDGWNDGAWDDSKWAVYTDAQAAEILAQGGDE